MTPPPPPVLHRVTVGVAECVHCEILDAICHHQHSRSLWFFLSLILFSDFTSLWDHACMRIFVLFFVVSVFINKYEVRVFQQRL